MLEVIVIILVLLIVVMLVGYYFHIQRLEKLLKARDLPEYYRSEGKNVVLDPNTIAQEEENEIILDDSRPFDLPASFNLEYEGQQGSQKITIVKD